MLPDRSKSHAKKGEPAVSRDAGCRGLSCSMLS